MTEIEVNELSFKASTLVTPSLPSDSMLMVSMPSTTTVAWELSRYRLASLDELETL